MAKVGSEVQLDDFLEGHRPQVVSVAAVLPFVACIALGSLRGSVASSNAALVLVLIVVAAASTGIRLAGLVAALSCTAWFDFFLTEPYHHFTITDPADVETAVLLILVGVAVSEVALWGRRQQAKASREQGYLDGVLSTATTVGGGRRSTSALVDDVCEHIVDILQIDRCRFDPGTDPVLAILNEDATITYNGRPHDAGRHGLPTDSEIALAIQGGGVVRGRFLLTAATRVVRPTQEQLRVVAALASQVGTALTISQLNGHHRG